MKKGIKDAVAPQGMFEDLGLKYVGPVDGHDVEALESALRRAKRFGGPVIVHAVTRKGYGYRPAEDDEADCLHGPGAFDPRDRQAAGRAVAQVDVGVRRRAGRDRRRARRHRRHHRRDGRADRHRAARRRSTRTGPSTSASPSSTRSRRAAGLAMGGMHPVVAVYATFLNRAFDQVLLDVAMHRLPVTFVLDRAGITGPDGPSHYGMWDMSVFGVVPGLRIAAPRDAATLREELREAVAIADGPTIVRFPTGSVPADLPALRRRGPVGRAGRRRRPGRAAGGGRCVRRISAWRSRRVAAAGLRGDRRRPALGAAGAAGTRRDGPRARSRRHRRGRRTRRRRRGRAGEGDARRRGPDAAARPRCRGRLASARDARPRSWPTSG